ncbi:MAG: hypothetical protein Q9167_002196 [Letrouitia subvulpina]
MFLCAIHGFIVAQIALPYPLGNLQVNAVCPDCHRDWKGQHTQSGHARDGASYALLSEDDVESHAGTGIRMNDGDATPRTQRQPSEAPES